jgi:C1A family cysteine protease
MLDCVTKSFGCNGGYPTDVYEWVNKTQGINLDSAYPYTGVQSPTCKFNQAGSLVMKTFYEWTISGDETDLKYQLAYYGPVSVIVDASEWQNYIGGVFKCTSSPTSYNHAVLVVGYNTDPTLGDYWIVKNSWGTGWGEQGYIRIARNKGNVCGIATYATYPITYKPNGNPFKWD